MNRSMFPESVGLLLDSVDEAEAVVKSQLRRNTAWLFYRSSADITTHGLISDPTSLLGFTYTREHLLRPSGEDASAPFDQVDARTGQSLGLLLPKWVTVRKWVGSQACLDIVPGSSQVASPGKQHTIEAYGSTDQGEKYMSGVDIKRYRGGRGSYNDGFRVVHSFSRDSLYGTTVIDFSPELEPRAVVSQRGDEYLSGTSCPNWGISDGAMPDSVVAVVENTAANILSLAETTDQL